MNCFFCKGNLVDGTTTFMTEIDGCAIIIKNVPAKICSQCGEASYSDEVAKNLKKLLTRCVRQSLKLRLLIIALRHNKMLKPPPKSPCRSLRCFGFRTFRHGKLRQ